MLREQLTIPVTTLSPCQLIRAEAEAAAAAVQAFGASPHPVPAAVLRRDAASRPCEVTAPSVSLCRWRLPLPLLALRGVAASARVRQPRWRGTKSCRGTLGPCDGRRQSRGLAHTPCPACATVPAALGEGQGHRTPSPLLRAMGRPHTQLGWPWMPHEHTRALPSCHPGGVQGEDPAVAGMNPSKPTRESRTPSWEHRERPVRCPDGFRGAAASRIPLKANPQGLHPAHRALRGTGVLESPQNPHPRAGAALGAAGPV